MPRGLVSWGMGGRELDGGDLERLLSLYVESGADEAIGDVARNHFAEAAEAAAAPVVVAGTPVAARRGAPLKSDAETAADARAIAAACGTLEELRAAMEAFDGCGLKKTATQLVFADGNPESGLMLIGEAPGGDEDRIGRPFVGPAGKLLDRMLAAIGRDRASAYITNIVPWRPPGNRKPSTGEVAVCLPFLRRHIELAAPRVLVLVGGVPAGALLETSQGITRLRGRWQSYHCGGDDGGREIPVMPIFHTAYLLRSPANKKETWRDLLAIRRRMAEAEQLP